MRTFKLNVMQCAKMVLATVTPSAFAYIILLFIRCDDRPIAGITTSYMGSYEYSTYREVQNTTEIRCVTLHVCERCNNIKDHVKISHQIVAAIIVFVKKCLG